MPPPFDLPPPPPPPRAGGRLNGEPPSSIRFRHCDSLVAARAVPRGINPLPSLGASRAIRGREGRSNARGHGGIVARENQ
jgi:hypothetical protein